MLTLPILALSLFGLLALPAWAGDEVAFAPDKTMVGQSDRAAIADFYRSDYRKGHCPEGLIRTEQGCSRKPLWSLGAPLDPSVAIEPLPEPLLAQLSAAPEGCRYIRVGDRILLMESGSRVVLGELLDLGRVGFGQVTPRLRLSGGSGASR